MDFDPSVFGGITNISVFSATGDALGFAHVNGNHVDAQFSSTSGGIGQVQGLPAFVVSLPVLSGLSAGQKTAVAVSMANVQLNDVYGNAYSTSAVAGTFQVGGGMAVQSVNPAGGLVPQGTVVQIAGLGFDSSTSVSVDGVSISSTHFVSSQQINVTLGAPTLMDAKHVRVASASKVETDLFCAMSSASQSTPSWPIIPLTTYKTVQWDYPIAHPEIYFYYALQNPTLSPVTVTFFNDPGLSALSTGSATIAPGALYFPYYFSLPSGAGQRYLTASAPIRMMAYQYQNSLGQAREYAFPPRLFSGLAQPNITSLQPWYWQIGTNPPESQKVNWLGGYYAFTVSIPAAAQKWLSVTPAQGSGPSDLTFTPNISGLGAGTYTTTVAITTALPSALSDLPPPVYPIPVTLNVSTSPLIVPSWPPYYSTSLNASLVSGSAPAQQEPLFVGCTSGACPIQVSATTKSGGSWLAVTAGATTSSPLVITLSAINLAVGTYSGQFTVEGPANSITLPVNLTVTAPSSPGSVSFVVAPSDSYIQGLSPPALTQAVGSNEGNVSGVSVQTLSGGDWLSAGSAGFASFQVTANPAGLELGTYRGAVAVTAKGGSFSLPVALTLLGPPAAGLTVSPTSLSFSAAAGQMAVAQRVTVSSPAVPALFSMGGSIQLGGTANWLNSYCSICATLVDSTLPITSQLSLPSPDPTFLTPVAPASIDFRAGAAQPGTYYGSLQIQWSGGSANIPIILSVPASVPELPPLMASVVDAASLLPGPLSPGQIIGIIGIGIGPGPTAFSLDSKEHLPTLIGGTQALIGGIAAPLVYVSSSQIDAIVPYEVGNNGTAAVQVISNGLQTAAWGLPVVPAAPAIFAVSGSGVGQAAVVNPDASVNSSTNPAAAGSVIQIYANGGGQTAPPSTTGSVSGNSPNTTLFPVTVSVGGADALVTYNGSAPGEIAGVLQVNAVVPTAATPGPAVPLFISVGGQQSQAGVTIAIK